jgi:WD40 repeat protein
VNDRRLRDRLARLAVPNAEAAEERAWRVVDSAFARRPPARGAARRLRPVLALAVLLLVLAVALTPAGAAVGDWIRDAVKPGARHARPSLDSLPAAGRLLVTSSGGAWVVDRGGSTRRLGRYDEVGWSPHGLFVVATRGRQLVALDPRGEVRWTLAGRERVRRPAWSPGDGFRIAYLSGSSLRAVAGDGTGDHPVARGVAQVTPAWRPGPGHVVAFARRDGTVSVADVDARQPLWRRAMAGVPVALGWTPDGSRLVAVTRRELSVLSASGRVLARAGLGPDGRAPALAVAPDGRAAAVVVHDRMGRSEVDAFSLRGDALRGPRRLFAGQGRFSDLAWSPDGRWLLVSWPDADQWLFVRSTRVRKLDAVSGIRRQFDPGGEKRGRFPSLGGWCCAG